MAEVPVQISTAGVYDLTFRGAGESAGVLRASVNGVCLGADVAIPATGGWQEWQDVFLRGAILDAGEHNLMIEVVRAGFNLNYVQFDLATTHVPPAIQTERLPEVIVGSQYRQTLTVRGGGTLPLDCARCSERIGRRGAPPGTLIT